MRSRVIIFAALLLVFSWIVLLGYSRHDQAASSAIARDFRVADPLETVKESWAKDRRLLITYEREQSTLRAEVIKRRRLYQEGRISKAEVVEAEQGFIRMLAHIHRLRRSIEASDMAIAEATLRDEMSRTPASPLKDSMDHFTHFNGRWSLKDARRVEDFYAQTFGRRLPITAFGQTATHDHLRFDHRDSMDVALHPDSVEGKALIRYMRNSGIPFIAFKGPVAGASTGAHIHIGRPSHRTAAVN